jgi:uncharacterized membrane protein
MLLFILVLHIVGGAVGLLTGTVNFFAKKGGNFHKIVGKLFVYGMLTSSVCSLVLSILHPNYLLFMIGIFTLYMVGTGIRYIHFKKLESYKAGLLDWILTVALLVAAIFFMITGIWLVIKSLHFGLVCVVFSLFALFFVKQDCENYRGKSKLRNYWLLAHLSRMTGGYIASLTAFLVVNAQYLPRQIPVVVIWLFPSLILVPFIIGWSIKLAVKK